jgi:excinuclease UvrABC ATPase subunit
MIQHKDPNILINDMYTHLKDDCEEWMSKVLRYDTLNATIAQQHVIELYQLTVMEYLNAIKQLKDIAFHYYCLRETDSISIHKYMNQFDEKLTNLTEVVGFVLEYGHK